MHTASAPGILDPVEVVCTYAILSSSHTSLLQSCSYDGSSKLHLQFHGACLEVLAHLVGKRVPLELTALFAAAEDERKYSKVGGIL